MFLTTMQFDVRNACGKEEVRTLPCTMRIRLLFSRKITRGARNLQLLWSGLRPVWAYASFSRGSLIFIFAPDRVMLAYSIINVYTLIYTIEIPKISRESFVKEGARDKHLERGHHCNANGNKTRRHCE